MMDSALTVGDRKPLSVADGSRLQELEQTIRDNMQGFVAVGKALAEIREKELSWKAYGLTFEEYARNIFDISRPQAYRYIGAAEVMENVSNWRQSFCEAGEQLMLPMNEAQIRPLVGLSPEEQCGAWDMVISTAKEGKITANLVTEAVAKLKNKSITKKTVQQRHDVANNIFIDPEFGAAFAAFLEKIQEAAESGWKKTDRGSVLRHLHAAARLAAKGESEIDERAFLGGSSDRNKLMRAGFTVIRMDPTMMSIKELGATGWRKLEGPFDTKAAMEEAFSMLLNDEKTVQG